MRLFNPKRILNSFRARACERERGYYSCDPRVFDSLARYPRAIRAPTERESSRASSSYPRMQIGTRILPFVRLPAPIYLLSRLARPCCKGAARISSYRSAVHPRHHRRPPRPGMLRILRKGEENSRARSTTSSGLNYAIDRAKATFFNSPIIRTSRKQYLVSQKCMPNIERTRENSSRKLSAGSSTKSIFNLSN